MNRNLLLNFSALLLLLLVVQYVVSILCSPLAASLTTAAMALAIKVFVDKKLLETTDVFGPVSNELKKFSGFFDLAAAIVAIHLFVLLMAESFSYALTDLQAKGFLAFNGQTNGLEHLTIYFYGFVGAPVLLLVLGYYGASLGKSDRKFSYLELAICITAGVFFVKLLLLLGGATSLQKLSKANPSLPIGTLPLQIVFRVALYITQSLVCAFYVWLVAKICRLFNRPPGASASPQVKEYLTSMHT